MLKQFVTALFISFFSLASSLALAETVGDNMKTRSVTIALNQDTSKYILKSSNNINNGEVVTDLNTLKTQNAMVKPDVSNGEQSGWLLAFALFGFVMLSNRRGV